MGSLSAAGCLNAVIKSSLQLTLILPCKLRRISLPSVLSTRTKGAENIFVLLLVNPDKRGGQAGRASGHWSSLSGRLHRPGENILV